MRSGGRAEGTGASIGVLESWRQVVARVRQLGWAEARRRIWSGAGDRSRVAGRERLLQVEERLVLTATHALHVVTIGRQRVVVGTSPQGMTVVAAPAWGLVGGRTQEAAGSPVGSAGGGFEEEW